MYVFVTKSFSFFFVFFFLAQILFERAQILFERKCIQNQPYESFRSAGKDDSENRECREWAALMPSVLFAFLYCLLQWK